MRHGTHFASKEAARICFFLAATPSSGLFLAPPEENETGKRSDAKKTAEILGVFFPAKPSRGSFSAVRRKCKFELQPGANFAAKTPPEIPAFLSAKPSLRFIISALQEKRSRDDESWDKYSGIAPENGRPNQIFPFPQICCSPQVVCAFTRIRGPFLFRPHSNFPFYSPRMDTSSRGSRPPPPSA